MIERTNSDLPEQSMFPALTTRACKHPWIAFFLNYMQTVKHYKHNLSQVIISCNIFFIKVARRTYFWCPEKVHPPFLPGFKISSSAGFMSKKKYVFYSELLRKIISNVLFAECCNPICYIYLLTMYVFLHKSQTQVTMGRKVITFCQSSILYNI